MSQYHTVIGLETHAELNTKTKIFCGCKNEFGSKANTNVCPVCLGLPGALPLLNRSVVEYAVRMGLALNCTINGVSYMDRKNYYYPDLPKAYQISQSFVPLCENGFVEFWYDGQIRKVRIERIHIEEDAGKLIHGDDNCGETFIDFNRCGVPLIEIVSKPDIKSSGEAYTYLKTLKAILNYLDICDCRMQEGSIRCDVNVSVNKDGEALGTRCEMKNVNSFSAVSRAIDYESHRQIELLSNGENIDQQTLRWDDIKGKNFLLRTKENADDYRYFPEPDIPCVFISDNDIKKLAATIPELPNKKMIRYISEYELDPKEAEYIAFDQSLSQFFDECINTRKYNAKSYCRWVMGELAKHLNASQKELSQTKLTSANLNDLLDAVNDNVISNSAAKAVFEVLLEKGGEVDSIITGLGLAQISDTKALEAIAKQVIDSNEKSVQDYRNGRSNALGFLIGQCMKHSNNKANPVKVKEILLALLG